MSDKHTEMLDAIGEGLSEALEEIYGKKVGFAFFMFEFGSKTPGDYVSNAKREDMIKFMRELADRLEKRDYIPRSIGEA